MPALRKLLWPAVALVLAVAALAGWWAYSALDRLVASAIRTYAPEIVGVPVKLGGVKIEPARGRAALRGLVVGNPTGFKTPHALELGAVSLALDVESLTQDVVVIQEITVEQPIVTYEYAAGGSNLDVIQRQVEGFVATHAKGKSGSGGTSIKLIIGHVTIRGAQANVSASLLQGKAVTVTLPDVHINNIGKKAGGVSPAEAAREIVAAITQATKAAVLPAGPGGVVDAVKGLFGGKP